MGWIQGGWLRLSVVDGRLPCNTLLRATPNAIGQPKRRHSPDFQLVLLREDCRESAAMMDYPPIGWIPLEAQSPPRARIVHPNAVERHRLRALVESAGPEGADQKEVVGALDRLERDPELLLAVTEKPPKLLLRQECPRGRLRPALSSG